MRRHLMTLALAGLVAVLATSEAQACHKKKCNTSCAPAPAPCVVVEQPCPPPPPPVVCEPAPKKCGLFKHAGGCGHKKMGGGLCHKKAPAPCVETVVYAAPCETYAPAPVVYAAPQITPSAQVHASGQ